MFAPDRLYSTVETDMTEEKPCSYTKLRCVRPRPCARREARKAERAAERLLPAKSYPKIGEADQ